MPETRRRAPTPSGGDGARRRPVVVRPQTVRAGVTSFATLAGLSCYVFLAQWHINALLAGVLGFAFALLVRVAAGSLAREWLAAHAAPPESRTDASHPNGRATTK
jgi:hypothetical protein